MRWLYLILLCLYGCCLYGQTASYRYVPSRYELERVDLHNQEDVGLFNDAVADKEGYLWFSGTKGLQVYDGHRLTGYTNSSRQYPIKKDSSVENFGAVSCTSSGLFYIQEQTCREYICFDPVLRKLRYELRPATPDGKLDLLSVAPDGSIMALHLDSHNGIYRIYKGIPKQKEKPVYRGRFRVNSGFLSKYGAGNHWFASADQIIRAGPDGTIKRYQLPGTDISVFRIFADTAHLFLLGNKGRDIYTWDREKDSLVLFAALPVSFPQANARFVVKGDLIYIGDHRSLFIINRADKTVQDLSADYTSLTKVGSSGIELAEILFAGTDDIYIVRHNEVYRMKKRMPASSLFIQNTAAVPGAKSFRALAEDEQQNIYASYYNGLLRKAKGTDRFRAMPKKNGFPRDPISTYSLSYWKGHLLWNNMLMDLGTHRYQYLDTDSFFSHHTSQYLCGDTLWFYPWLSGRLYRYNLQQKQLSIFTLDDRLGSPGEPVEELNDMTGDASGNYFWVATKWQGIALITKQGKLVKKYSPRELGLEEGLGGNINVLYRSGKNLWFGCTRGVGVLDLLTGKTTLYDNPILGNDNIFRYNTIFSIVPDTADNLYLGSRTGILFFNTREHIFYTLPQRHPLAQIECNRASAFRASNNRYYFGTVDGLYSFTPSALQFVQASVPIKPLKLVNTAIFNGREKEYRYLGAPGSGPVKLVLQPSDNNVTFTFSVPEFDRDVYYAYRIRELNEHWREYNPDNKIVLYNLAPGAYTLEVKASTDVTDYNCSRYMVRIKMEQVWYKKIWVITLFLLGIVAITIVAVHSAFRRKLKREQQLAALRTRISMDLHDDVGSLLSGLAVQSEMLSYAVADKHKVSLNEISSLSRSAMEHMRDIVWSMDHRKDKYENLIDRMRSFAAKILPARGIAYDFTVDNISGSEFIDPGKRQAVYLIFKEAITNISKHSDGKHVAIKMNGEQKKLQMTIRDNGSSGVLVPSDGMGLSNMKLRAERAGGNLSITYDQGVLVSLTI